MSRAEQLWWYILIEHTGMQLERNNSYSGSTISHYGYAKDVGGSYYPAWASEQGSSDNTPNGMLSWASAMETAIGKPIMVMETGYSWNQYRPSGRNGGNYEGQMYKDKR